MENNKAHVTGVEQVFVAERDGKAMDVMAKLDIQGSMHAFYQVIIFCIDCLVKMYIFKCVLSSILIRTIFLPFHI